MLPAKQLIILGNNKYFQKKTPKIARKQLIFTGKQRKANIPTKTAHTTRKQQIFPGKQLKQLSVTIPTPLGLGGPCRMTIKGP